MLRWARQAIGARATAGQRPFDGTRRRMRPHFGAVGRPLHICRARAHNRGMTAVGGARVAGGDSRVSVRASTAAPRPVLPFIAHLVHRTVRDRDRISRGVRTGAGDRRRVARVGAAAAAHRPRLCAPRPANRAMRSTSAQLRHTPARCARGGDGSGGRVPQTCPLVPALPAPPLAHPRGAAAFNASAEAVPSACGVLGCWETADR